MMKKVVSVLLMFLCISVVINAQSKPKRDKSKDQETMVASPSKAKAVAQRRSLPKAKKTKQVVKSNRNSNDDITESRWAENRNSYEMPVAVVEKTGFSDGVLMYKGVKYEFVKVYGGSFMMGATAEQRSPSNDEKPVHRVTLNENYYVGKTEVTQALWKAVMGYNPSMFKGDNRPVENVSWVDCQNFVSKLNAATGAKFRLPTESEWEFAASGGFSSNGYQYSGSDRLTDIAWYRKNGNDESHDVATKQPNELGLYDMSGNVWEWCSDLYGPYDGLNQTDPKGASSGNSYVIRGGSWSSHEGYCRVASRENYFPGSIDCDLGLRLVVTAER